MVRDGVMAWRRARAPGRSLSLFVLSDNALFFLDDLSLSLSLLSYNALFFLDDLSLFLFSLSTLFFIGRSLSLSSL